MASELHVDAIKHSGGTSALTIDSDGTILPQKVPACKLVHTASVGDATRDSTSVFPFDTAEINTHSMADLTNNRINFTSSTAGLYHVGCNLRINIGSYTITRFIVKLEKNSSTLTQVEYADSTTSVSKYPHIGCDTIASFANGDNIRMTYYLQTGAGVTLNEGSSSNGLYCYRIST